MINYTNHAVQRTRTMYTPDPYTVTKLIDDWYPFACSRCEFDQQVHDWCTNEFGYGGLSLKQSTEELGMYTVERDRRWAFWHGYRFNSREHVLNFKLRWGS